MTGATNEQPCDVGQDSVPQVTDPEVLTVAKLRHCPPAQPLEQVEVEVVPLLVQVTNVVQSKLVQRVLPSYHCASLSSQSPEFSAYPDMMSS